MRILPGLMIGLGAGVCIAACSTTPDLSYGASQNEAGAPDGAGAPGSDGQADTGTAPEPDAAQDVASSAETGTDAGNDAGADVGGQDSADVNVPDVDAATCTLPAGATVCCGVVPCTDSGGSCGNKCNACQACTGGTPVCCAKGPSANEISCKPSPTLC